MEVGGLAVSSSGDVFIGGTYKGSTAKVESTSLTATSGGYNVFLAKFSSSGSLSWAYGYGSGASEYIHDIALDSSGNIIAVGHSDSNSASLGTGLSLNFGGPVRGQEMHEGLP